MVSHIVQYFLWEGLFKRDRKYFPCVTIVTTVDCMLLCLFSNRSLDGKCQNVVCQNVVRTKSDSQGDRKMCHQCFLLHFDLFCDILLTWQHERYLFYKFQKWYKM